MRGLGVERLIIAAFSIGNARRALEDAIAYMRQRDAFGSHISDFQALRHRVADIAMTSRPPAPSSTTSPRLSTTVTK